MLNTGIDFGFLFFQLFYCGTFIVWMVLSAFALFSLRKHHLSDTARVLWVMLVVIVPVLGAVAYWIMRPGEEGGVG